MKTRARRTALWTALGLTVCAGAAALLGGLSRAPSPLVETASPADPTSPPLEPARAPEKPSSRARIFVESPAPTDGLDVARLPPLPEGTTTQDLLATYVKDVCACEDMPCVEAARLRSNHYFGQAVRVRKAVDNRALNQRAYDCIAELSTEEERSVPTAVDP